MEETIKPGIEAQIDALFNQFDIEKPIRVFSMLVENKPGVLCNISGIFGKRGCNIRNLYVAETSDPNLSRITMVTDGDISDMSELLNLLDSDNSVIDVQELSDTKSLKREMALIKINTKPEQIDQIKSIADRFNCSLVDKGNDCTIEVSGDREKLFNLLNSLKPIVDIEKISRTGFIALQDTRQKKNFEVKSVYHKEVDASFNQFAKDSVRAYSMLVDNKPGVLSKVSGLFSDMGCNIRNLCVAETSDPGVSRLTMLTDDKIIENDEFVKGLKEITKSEIHELTSTTTLKREMALIKVSVRLETSEKINRIINMFNCQIVEEGSGYSIIEVSGDENKITSVIEELEPIGILEMARTGYIKMN